MECDAYPMHKAPRCTAHAKRTGLSCGNPAVRGWKVCRMHGAKGGARSGVANPAYRHGGRTKEAMALRATVAEIAQEARELADLILQAELGGLDLSPRNADGRTETGTSLPQI